MNQIRCSLFQHYWNRIGDKSIEEIVDHIKSKDKVTFEALRSYDKSNLTEIEKCKRQLLAFTPSGVFTGNRSMSGLATYNKLVILEIDDLFETHLKHARFHAFTLPFTFLCFTSARSNGLKIVVKVDSELKDHAMAFQKVAHYYQQQINRPINPSGVDPLRLSFFSYDPEIYYAPDSQTFIVNPVKVSTQTKTEAAASGEGGETAQFVQFASDPIQQKVSLESPEGSLHENKELSDIANKEAPINSELASVVSEEDDSDEALDSVEEHSPMIPDHVYEKLPLFLRVCCKEFSGRKRDIFLISAISNLSACFQKVMGVYGQRYVSPNLYSFTVAPAASGKGSLSFSYELIQAINRRMLDESLSAFKAYEDAVNMHKSSKGAVSINPVPIKPKFSVLNISANSSSAALLAQLRDNDGIGLMCDSEADTLTNSIKQDWGNFSDILRKAFHHEPINSSRKGEGHFNDYISIDHPALSVTLTGTPGQVTSLIGSAENGLFSRFIYYKFYQAPVWESPFGSSIKMNLSDFFTRKALEVDNMHCFINRKHRRFSLTFEQENRFNSEFTLLLNKALKGNSNEIAGVVYRIGLITFRIAMVLSLIDSYDKGSDKDELFCSDELYEVAINISKTIIRHSIHLYSLLPKSSNSILSVMQQTFFDKLPVTFNRNQAIKIAEKISVKERTADKYLKNLLDQKLITIISHGKYQKADQE
ncbi:MAG: DUF3987 domain-containing protein [Hydrotalea sp.]|nr:DUF3987 domain-containing protein [Hydrotalea sp.]